MNFLQMDAKEFVVWRDAILPVIYIIGVVVGGLMLRKQIANLKAQIETQKGIADQMKSSNEMISGYATVFDPDKVKKYSALLEEAAAREARSERQAEIDILKEENSTKDLTLKIALEKAGQDYTEKISLLQDALNDKQNNLFALTAIYEASRNANAAHEARYIALNAELNTTKQELLHVRKKAETVQKAFLPIPMDEATKLFETTFNKIQEYIESDKYTLKSSNENGHDILKAMQDLSPFYNSMRDDYPEILNSHHYGIITQAFTKILISSYHRRKRKYINLPDKFFSVYSIAFSEESLKSVVEELIDYMEIKSVGEFGRYSNLITTVAADRYIMPNMYLANPEFHAMTNKFAVKYIEQKRAN